MKNIFILILVIISLGCNRRTKEINSLVKYWTNKEIFIPKSLEMKIYGKDTSCLDILQKQYKILNYCDTSECISCNLDFFKWNRLLKEIDSLQMDVSIVYIIQAINYQEIEYSQFINSFNNPLFYDKLGEIDKLNSFPKDKNFRTFLLDHNNKILLIGNPTLNEKIWKLYKKIILQGNN